MQVQQACFGSYQMAHVAQGGTAVDITVTTATTPVLIGHATSIVSDTEEQVGVTTGATPKLTAKWAGLYKARYQAILRGGNDKICMVKLGKNGTALTQGVSRVVMLATASDMSVQGEAFVNLAQGDYIQAFADAGTNGDVVSFRELLVSLELVKETK